MADSVMTAKLVIKELAQLSGAYASFMPKPITGVNGSGMHVHQSLFRGDSTPSTTWKTSSTCRSPASDS
jgi:glutamine synthetase